MYFEVRHIDETDSTNRWLKTEGGEWKENTVKCIVAEYQTAGKGCGTNSWESERGKNLLLSMLIHPNKVAAADQFILSMVNALALKRTLDNYVSDITIKWPNDIYWRDKKICGTLIETTLQGSLIKDCIIGTGMNINQQVFKSDAPNPVSLYQLLGHEVNREEVLQQLLDNFGALLDEWDADHIRASYRQQLYRREGLHPYRDADGTFEATLMTVEDDGHLLLKGTEGRVRRYAFKEVSFAP